ATGRSRLQLFGARIPGGLALLYSAIAAAFTVTATASIGLAGSLQPPSAGLLLRSGAWIALIATLTFALSLGIASLVGSRSTSIAILLGWQLAVAPILIQID